MQPNKHDAHLLGKCDSHQSDSGELSRGTNLANR